MLPVSHTHLGNFFDFNPQRGSYEANPPFVPEMMDAMVAKVLPVVMVWGLLHKVL
jgi:hypothetical protein